MGFGEEVAVNLGGRTPAQKYGAADGVRQQFTGYQKDSESGLDFAQARYYNRHGRFTSVDPLTVSANVKDPQTFNRYTYALNSPYKFADPLGLLSVTTGACGQWCQGNDGGGGGHEENWQNFEFPLQQEDPPKKKKAAKKKPAAEPGPPSPAVGQNAEPTTQGDPVIAAAVEMGVLCDPNFDWAALEASLPTGTQTSTVNRATPTPTVNLINNKAVIDAMKSAWARSGNGTRNTEAGFLVFQTDEGIRTVDLPNTNQFDSISFNVTELKEEAKLSSSARLLAVFHTHPTNRSDQPSGDKKSGDNLAARSLSVPVYVMHRNGLSSISPAGDRTRYILRNLDWLDQRLP
jgi:RHS repeat-associated protein